MLVLADLQEQIELLGKERVVVLQPEAEQRKGLDGRAAADDHLRPALRQQIEGGELLKHPHRVGGAQDRDGAGETDALGSGRRRAENDRRGGIEELPAVVFADAKDVQADLIGVFDLFDQVAQPVRRADRRLVSSYAAAKLSMPICTHGQFLCDQNLGSSTNL